MSKKTSFEALRLRRNVSVELCEAVSLNYLHVVLLWLCCTVSRDCEAACALSEQSVTVYLPLITGVRCSAFEFQDQTSTRYVHTPVSRVYSEHGRTETIIQTAVSWLGYNIPKQWGQTSWQGSKPAQKILYFWSLSVKATDKAKVD